MKRETITLIDLKLDELEKALSTVDNADWETVSPLQYAIQQQRDRFDHIETNKKLSHMLDAHGCFDHPSQCPACESARKMPTRQISRREQ